MSCSPAAFALLYYGGIVGAVMVALCVIGLLRIEQRRVPVEAVAPASLSLSRMECFREDRQLTRDELPPVYPDDEDS
ncbi:MAG: hypothetical protein JWM95_1703 [Gemmatimonadetes bacterium]|nr:hypothetical protein [Gemmatimonadota bacterium]